MITYFIICFGARILLKIFFRIRVDGIRNIPRKGPFIIAPNHISFLDPVAAGAFIPRSLYYMARDTLFDIPFLGALIKACHTFPVRRGKPHPRTMKKALSILKSGNGLLLFPEGTRSINGKLREGSPGLGMLASLSGAPVIPTLLEGTEKALPVHAEWIRMKKVRVRYGKPVFPHCVKGGKRDRELYQAISKGVMKRIGDMQNGA